MNSKKFAAYIRLSRPANVLITLVSIPVACWIAGGTIAQVWSIVLAAITGALVTAGANAINDVFDIEIDRINRPTRLLPSGTISIADARMLWLWTSVVSIGLNLCLDPVALIIVCCSITLLYYYSARLKRSVLVGNLVVGFMTGMAFLYGGVVVGSLQRSLMPAIFAFFVNLARELVKDVEDIEGDRSQHAATLPVKYGIFAALILATLAVVLLLGATGFAVWLSIYSIAFHYVVACADILLIGAVIMMWIGRTPEKMRVVSTLLKASMVVGLVSIIIGSL
jgi:geranylgeranylglycerol-phosphate geranylgeranyltransferase